MNFKQKQWIIIFLMSFLQYLVLCDDYLVEINVDIDDGTIMGKFEISQDLQMHYYSFQGIPFAVPPLNDLRFEPPVPNEKWDHVFDGTHNKSACIQFDGSGSEDCLYINVYSPNISSQAKLPVMVWIYGGAFRNGDGSKESFNPEYLVEEGIVFAAFNYRLGIFGWISTEDQEAPGNAGLKDQILALKWVKKNIDKFGGNPENITIVGESAGAASVSILTQLPATKGLFHNAIMQSGSSLCLWSRTKSPRETAFKVGEMAGIRTRNSRTLIEELKKIDAVELQVNAALMFDEELVFINAFNGLPFGPVLEVDNPSAVFTKMSHQSLESGDFHHVPMIIGHTSAELILFTYTDLVKFLFPKYDISPDELVPNNMNLNRPSDISIKNQIGWIIKARYFSTWSSIILSSNTELAQFLSDDQFYRPITEFAKLASKYTKVYFYNFDYADEIKSTDIEPQTGVGHEAELPYLFKDHLCTKLPKENKLMKSRLVRLWTNFAKFSDPTPTPEDPILNIKWYPINHFNETNMVILKIGDNLTLDFDPNQSCMKFYSDLYREFGKPPYDTY